jgi:hypothetical protein
MVRPRYDLDQKLNISYHDFIRTTVRNTGSACSS